MKKIATNTLATLVLIGIISLSSVSAAAMERKSTAQDRYLRQLERVYKRHDRKHELRASILGISPEELREQLREKNLDVVVKKYGFKDRFAFYIALTGKLKDELYKRGWTERKIEQFVQKRITRLASLPQLAPDAV